MRTVGMIIIKRNPTIRLITPSPKMRWCSFSSDGHVIYGLSADASYPDYASSLLSRMKSFLGSDLGYITHEASPDAENLEQFKEEIK